MSIANARPLAAALAAAFLLAHSQDGSAAEHVRETSLSRIVSYLSGHGQRAPLNGPHDAALGASKSSAPPISTWGGAGCVSSDELRADIDDYLATPDASFFPERGPTIPGLSASWSATRCGTFTYAAGLKQVEKDRSLTPDTLMGIASMGKVVVAAITLQLNAQGAFGPLGLDTPVSHLLPSDKIRQLTVGEDSPAPRCPGNTYLWNRVTFQFEFTTFTCPDLNAITLRNLMLANHGMYDFLNEVLLADGNWQYEESVFYELYKYLGIDAVPPVSASNGFDYLKAFGLKRNDAAHIGGTQGRDFEASLGNTGFQLMGVILEQVTGKSLDNLIHQMVVVPLGIEPMFVHLAAGQWENLISSGYEAYTGDPLIEQSGVYAVTTWHGHTLLNNAVLGLGKPANLNVAGGAGGFVANMASYRIFIDKFVNGGLLDSGTQAEFEASFVPVPDFSSPVVEAQVGFGFSKLKVTGSPVAPDNVLFWHGGSLPGVLCVNAVLWHHDTEEPLGAGSMCQNSHGSGYPSIFDLWNVFITAVVTSGGAAE